MRCCPVIVENDSGTGISQFIAPGVEETLGCFCVDNVAFDNVALLVTERVSRFVDSKG